MLAGMYVVRNAAPTQVTSLTAHGTRLSSMTGPATRGTQYGLLNISTGERYTLDNPLAVDVPLLPACPVCEARPGFPCNDSRLQDSDDAWHAEMKARVQA